jgi:hypothetical protein
MIHRPCRSTGLLGLVLAEDAYPSVFMLSLDWPTREIALPGFSTKRFDELVLYIAERTQDDKSFGSTKLAKVLFFSDFEAFRDLGAPITGAEYQKWAYGPYPPQLKPARKGLEYASRARVIKGRDYRADRLIPTRIGPADLRAVGISAEQQAIVDRWITRIGRETASEISDFSHEHPGYQMVEDNEPIPYEAAFLAELPPSNDEIAKATRVARERGWLDCNKQRR